MLVYDATFPWIVSAPVVLLLPFSVVVVWFSLVVAILSLDNSFSGSKLLQSQIYILLFSIWPSAFTSTSEDINNLLAKRLSACVFNDVV